MGWRARSWILAALLLGAAPGVARAHLTITTGDIAIVGIWTNTAAGPVSFAFVTLSTFHPPESVNFTDRGWLSAGRFRAGEGETFWEVDRTTDPGTVIVLPGTAGISLEPGTDQVFAYLGTLMPDGTPTDSLLYGLNLGGPWAADATSTTTSALPAVLAGYDVELGPALDCAYGGRTSGTRTELLLAIGDASNWVCSDTVRPTAPAAFTVFAARGDPCSIDADCAGGDLCAYSVCCDTECRRDEAGHCQTCDYGLGDPRTGTCGAAPPTYLCRLGRGPCDPMDHCDGSSLDCPLNVLLDTSDVCRPSIGGCDPAEVCTGLTGDCPADIRADAGSVCRPSRGVCDPEERCGTDSACPADDIVDDGTDCDDGLLCTATSSCSSGFCAGPVPLECDDGDECTADSCSDAGGCMNVAIEGCCAEDADCDDGDPCTLDTCDPDGWCVPGTNTLCIDAGPAPIDAGAEPPPPPPQGCGCSSTSDERSSGLWLVALVAVVWRRRR